MRLFLLTIAALAYLPLSGCRLLKLVYPEGMTILVPFATADPWLNTMGGRAMTFDVETPFSGPVPQLSSEGKAYPGFAVFEPIHDTTGLWQSVRMVEISTQVNQVVSQLHIPPDLYKPPTRVGIQAYLLRNKNVVEFTAELDNPDSSTLDTLATHPCADLALKVFVSKTGYPSADGVVPLVSTSSGKPCVTRERDTQHGI